MDYLKRKIYLLIFIIGVVSTLIVGMYDYNHNIKKREMRLDAISQIIIQQIQNRMDTYREVLYAGLGLFEASSNVSKQEWNIFTNQLQIKKYFPGIQGLGYSVVLRGDELQ